MKLNTTLSKLILLMFIISSSHCKKEKSINVIVNEALEGTWYATQVISSGVIMPPPRFGHHKIVIEPNEEDGGTFYWPFGMVDDSYRIINNGTQISVNGTIINIRKLTIDEIIVHGNSNPHGQNPVLAKIIAKKTL